MAVLSVALDGFDSPSAGCTTHLASLILLSIAKDLEASLADYPWLIRLNPGIPWKTRGNGAVVLHFLVDCKAEVEFILSRVKELAKEYVSKLNIAPSKACVLALVQQDHTRPHPRLKSFYRKAVTSLVHIDTALDLIKALNVEVVLGYGRGVIGALAALGADLSWDHTYELLTYRKPEYWVKRREVDATSVIEFDLSTRPYTFLNYDFEEKKVLITPRGTDPVLYGVRGEDPRVLLKALNIIEAGEEPSHWMIVRSNQATGVHYVFRHASRLRPYDTAVIEGVVDKVATIPGPHILIRLSCDGTTLYVAVYRETGRLLRKVRELVHPGALIRVGGVYKPHGTCLSINAEFVEVIESRRRSELHGIRCPLCGNPLERSHQAMLCPRCKLQVPAHFVLLTEHSNVVLFPSESAFHHLMVPPRRLAFMLKPKSLNRPPTPVVGPY